LKIVPTPLDGVYIVELEPLSDERGFFARSYCAEELRELLPHIEQSSISFNSCRGTVRGMHFQLAPHGEAKLVRCTRGAIFDVAVDLRTRRWFGTELTPDNDRMLFVPEGFGHGFQSLQDDTEVGYQISRRYVPEAASGFRWDDPQFDIHWPLEVSVISERDRSWPDFRA
jgi:dTDP-4-dehydrorhamnose 3,5-epimerase